MDSILKNETKRKSQFVNLIASENLMYPKISKYLGSSVLSDKYSEGTPGKRYYSGNEFIDKIEILCQERALKLYDLESTEWKVNVQAYSGSIANLAVYNSILEPQDKIMGMELPSGGHLTHGFYTYKRKVSISSKYYNSQQYPVDYSTGCINYKDLEKRIEVFKPKLLIIGGSSYPRDFNFSEIRRICNKYFCYLMYDMSHNCALVASKILKSGFDYCDFVTTTTHKTLRGPRGALIFYRQHFEKKINSSLFPGIQGGPHNNNIAGICVALGESLKPEFINYCLRIINFSHIFCNYLIGKGHKISTNGSDNGIILIKINCDSDRLVKFFELSNIDVNKNCFPGDESALKPTGLRIGTGWLAAKNLKSKNVYTIAKIVSEILFLAEIPTISFPHKTLKHFRKTIKNIVI